MRLRESPLGGIRLMEARNLGAACDDRADVPGIGAGWVPVDLQLYAGRDHFCDQEPQFCDAIAEAMAFFIARDVPACVAVTTS
jgi:hypothetical protein